jgi:hypothetical protein
MAEKRQKDQPNGGWRWVFVDLAIILELSILVRALFIAWMPALAISVDLIHWGDAAILQR